jgi:ABC-2 type transport system permease protein
MNATYLKYEVIRTLRNRQGFIFSLAFPLVMFFLIAGPNKGDQNFGNSGIPAVTYYMVGLIAFGTIGAVMSGGARISVDRAAGWNRQLRLSPLPPRTYLASKLLIGYLIAGMTIIVLYAAGISLGASMAFGRWLAMTGLVLVALIPFAALGVWVGHSFNVDAIGPIMGGGMALFAFLGGTWFPVVGVLKDIGSLLPSYWVVQAGHVGVGGHGWSAKGWTVIAAWTALAVALAVRACQADTKRA